MIFLLSVHLSFSKDFTISMVADEFETVRAWLTLHIAVVSRFHLGNGERTYELAP